jgi:hypothetical protein
MSLTVDETNMTVTPLLSQDLGVYSFALGSAHALGNGNYFFQPGTVAASASSSFAMELFPTGGTVNGTTVYNLQSATSYRAWLMPSLYFPPAF